jgi:hypothetical protein
VFRVHELHHTLVLRLVQAKDSVWVFRFYKRTKKERGALLRHKQEKCWRNLQREETKDKRHKKENKRIVRAPTTQQCGKMYQDALLYCEITLG